MRQGLYGAFIGPLDSWDTFFTDTYCGGERATGAEHSWLRWTNYLGEIESQVEYRIELAWELVSLQSRNTISVNRKILPS